MKPSIVLSLLSAVCALAAPAPANTKPKFTLYGINASGAEFSPPKFPKISDIDAWMAQGFNTFRVLFTMEHMTPDKKLDTMDNESFLGAPPAKEPNQTPKPGLYYEVIKHITDNGGYAVIVPWDSGTYGGVVLKANEMKQFWKTVATPFASNKNVIFDTNNEYNGTAQDCFDLNQAAIDGIRDAKATTQMIVVEGRDYTHASTWTTDNTNLKSLQDKYNNLVFEMHHYLDKNLNASSEECVNGPKSIVAASEWLKDNNLKGFMGEIAGGNDEKCVQMIKDILASMDPKYWVGALWWGGGQGDGTFDDKQHFYAFNPNPPTKAYKTYLQPLQEAFQIQPTT